MGQVVLHMDLIFKLVYYCDGNFLKCSLLIDVKNNFWTMFFLQNLLNSLFVSPLLSSKCTNRKIKKKRFDAIFSFCRYPILFLVFLLLSNICIGAFNFIFLSFSIRYLNFFSNWESSELRRSTLFLTASEKFFIHLSQIKVLSISSLFCNFVLL